MEVPGKRKKPGGGREFWSYCSLYCYFSWKFVSNLKSVNAKLTEIIFYKLPLEIQGLGGKTRGQWEFWLFSLMYFWSFKIWVWLVFLPWRCMRHSVAWVVLHEHHLINNHQPPAVHEVQSTFNMEIILFIFWNEWYSFIIRCNNNFTSRVVPCEKGDQKSNPLISVFFLAKTGLLDHMGCTRANFSLL